jgi:hypothetical protein
MELANKEWKEFFIEDIFEMKSGKRLIKAEMLNGDIPFIGATDSNNGITEFIANKNSSLDKNVLGVNYNGSVVYNFYHSYEAVFSDDVKRLSFKEIKGNMYSFLFVKALILQQKPKYEYGYKFNGEQMKRQKILLPVNLVGKPDYAFMESYMRQKEEKLLKQYEKQVSEFENVAPLAKKKWKEFKTTDIFNDIQRGKRLKKDDHKSGVMPYVSATGINNGMDGFVGNKEDVRIFSNCLTLANSGSVGATFYQHFYFIASDHVTKLGNSNFNKYIYLFIANITSRFSEKYGFNREINDTRIKKEKILLPTNSKNEPDYAYMENYMKMLESAKIKHYLEYKK